MVIWSVPRCLKLLQKHAVLKPPQQKLLQDDAMSVDTWKNMFNMYSHRLVLLLALLANAKRNATVWGAEKKLCILEILVTYFSPHII